METFRHTPDVGNLTPEERTDALADVLAEGFLYLAQNGLFKEVLTDPSPDAKRAESATMDRARTDAASDLSDLPEGR